MRDQIFLQHISNATGIIKKLTGLYATDDTDQEDLYQEILYQAWKAWPSFRADSKFSTWIYKICLNTLLTHKRKKRINTAPLDVEIQHPAIVQQSDNNEAVIQLYKAIRTLAETDRAIISLHLDGYD
ncbi:MAG: RNA polymerase sigma factor, partial [Ferruginibacter sp.]